METLETSRGIGRELELMGIKSSFIMVLAFCIVVGILLYFLLTMSGADTVLSLCTTIIWCFLCTVVIVVINRRYGEKGLIKILARRRIPGNIRIGKRSFILVKTNGKRS